VKTDGFKLCDLPRTCSRVIAAKFYTLHLHAYQSVFDWGFFLVRGAESYLHALVNLTKLSERLETPPHRIVCYHKFVDAL
jgi:hypothetical protein